MGSLSRKIQKNQNTQKVKTSQEAYYEGVKEGIEKGFTEGKKKGAEAGFVAGWRKACDHFLEVLEHLDEVPDIGPKRYQKIIERFGYTEKEEFTKQSRWSLEDIEKGE